MERIPLGRERREKLVQSFKGDAGSLTDGVIVILLLVAERLSKWGYPETEHSEWTNSKGQVVYWLLSPTRIMLGRSRLSGEFWKHRLVF